MSSSASALGLVCRSPRHSLSYAPCIGGYDGRLAGSLIAHAARLDVGKVVNLRDASSNDTRTGKGVIDELTPIQA